MFINLYVYFKILKAIYNYSHTPSFPSRIPIFVPIQDAILHNMYHYL